jgi:hypothetical protein
MGLSYHFSFRAPTADAGTLLEFLRTVEGDAQLMGFGPTIVTDAPFDTTERRNFARRCARPLTVEDARLKGRELPEHLYWAFMPEAGLCRLAPEHGLLLVVTDERGVEATFGFVRYPRTIHDRAGRKVMTVQEGDVWRWDGSVDSPDPRYRAIVRRFRDAGYIESEHDEFEMEGAC